MVGRAGVPVACLLVATGCGRLDRDCRAVTATANAFIAESASERPQPNATPEETVKAELATAVRYEKLAADLENLKVESSELSAEVTRYRALAEHSAASLRAVAAALARGDFDTARQKRIELDREAHGEVPLVAKINEICGAAHPSPDASL
ncbi:MAG TPA: hypothetical protein VMI54_21905 [Polyangiaceae bacterium]|nr:hypothetical protein [Polyangiaceae bacterium]